MTHTEIRFAANHACQLIHHGEPVDLKSVPERAGIALGPHLISPIYLLPHVLSGWQLQLSLTP